MRKRAPLILVILGLAAAPDARAGMPEAFGIGSRASAMGGAYTAIADDSYAAYYNPAGLAQGTLIEVSSGWFFATPNLKINGRGFESQDVSGPVMGFKAPFLLNTQKMAFGVTTFFPDHGRGLFQFKSERPDTIQWPLLDHSSQRLVFMPALALEVNRHLFLGIGGDLLLNVETDVGLRSVLTNDAQNEGSLVGIPLFLSAAPHGAGTSSLRLKSRPEFRFTAGLLAKLLEDRLRIGASYKAENEVPVEVNINGMIDFVSSTDLEAPLIAFDQSAFFQVPLFGDIKASDFFTPEEISLGIAFDPAKWVTLAFDATWRNWSEFSSIGVEGNFDEIDEIVMSQIFPVFPNSTGQGTIDFRPQARPKFEDIWIPRFGIELRPGSHLALRAGYAFEPSPVIDTRPTVIRNTLTQESTILGAATEFVHNEANIADGDKHIISGGIGLSMRDPMHLFKEPMSLDFHFQYLKIAERNFRTDFAPVYYRGDSDIMQPTELANPDGRFSASGHIWSLGMISTIKFY